jgi:hypothetical protein
MAHDHLNKKQCPAKAHMGLERRPQINSMSFHERIAWLVDQKEAIIHTNSWFQSTWWHYFNRCPREKPCDKLLRDAVFVWIHDLLNKQTNMLKSLRPWMVYPIMSLGSIPNNLFTNILLWVEDLQRHIYQVCRWLGSIISRHNVQSSFQDDWGSWNMR